MNTKFVDFAELLCKWMQFRTENRDQLKSYSPHFANIFLTFVPLFSSIGGRLFGLFWKLFSLRGSPISL